VSLKTAIGNDMSVFFNTGDFAESITFAGATVTAIVTYKDNPMQDGISRVRYANLELQKSEVASWIYRDAAVIGGVSWYATKEIMSDDYTWLLEIETNQRIGG